MKLKEYLTPCLFFLFCLPVTAMCASLSVDFNDGTMGPLVVHTAGEQRLEIKEGELVFHAPAAPGAPRYSSYADLHPGIYPLTGEILVEWHFPDIPALFHLADEGNPVTAGFRLFEKTGTWKTPQGNQIHHGVWFGCYIDENKNAYSVILADEEFLVRAPLSAESGISYRLWKRNNEFYLFSRVDNGLWEKVGSTFLTILEQDEIAISGSYFQIRDGGNHEMSVPVDDFLWEGSSIRPPFGNAINAFPFSIGGTGEERVAASALDSGGNLYLAGSFQNTVDFDPDEGETILNADQENSQEGTAVFTAAYDALGNFRWVRTIRSAGVCKITSIRAWGNHICISGSTTDTAYFDIHEGEESRPAIGAGGFLATLDRSGNYLWHHLFPVSSDEPLYVTLSTEGTILVCGSFQGELDLDPALDATFPVSSYTDSEGMADQDIFIAAYSAEGDFLWGKTAGGKGDDTAKGILLFRKNRVALLGFFQNEIRFAPEKTGLVSQGEEDAFLAMYGKNGTFINSSALSSSQKIHVSAHSLCAVQLSGNQDAVVAAGLFTGKIRFSSQAISYDLVADEGTGLFIAGFDTLGNPLGAVLGARLEDIPQIKPVAAYSQTRNTLFVGGQFSGTAAFDPNGEGSREVFAKGGKDAFISAWHTGDEIPLLGADAMGSDAETSYDALTSLRADPWGNICFIGEFTGISDILYQETGTSLTSLGKTDIFVARDMYTIDSDGDDVPDSQDNCPNDPQKVDPGDCGCGFGEEDSDGDGVKDCFDECPEDGNKTEEGLCGCFIEETDTDGDGTPDCNDDCPGDENKTDPGECGCHEKDVDADANGIIDCLETSGPGSNFIQDEGGSGCFIRTLQKDSSP